MFKALFGKAKRFDLEKTLPGLQLDHIPEIIKDIKDKGLSTEEDKEAHTAALKKLHPVVVCAFWVQFLKELKHTAEEWFAAKKSNEIFIMECFLYKGKGE